MSIRTLVLVLLLISFVFAQANVQEFKVKPNVAHDIQQENLKATKAEDVKANAEKDSTNDVHTPLKPVIEHENEVHNPHASHKDATVKKGVYINGKLVSHEGVEKIITKYEKDEKAKTTKSPTSPIDLEKIIRGAHQRKMKLIKKGVFPVRAPSVHPSPKQPVFKHVNVHKLPKVQTKIHSLKPHPFIVKLVTDLKADIEKVSEYKFTTFNVVSFTRGQSTVGTTFIVKIKVDEEMFVNAHIQYDHVTKKAQLVSATSAKKSVKKSNLPRKVVDISTILKKAQQERLKRQHVVRAYKPVKATELNRRVAVLPHKLAPQKPSSPHKNRPKAVNSKIIRKFNKAKKAVSKAKAKVVEKKRVLKGAVGKSDKRRAKKALKKAKKNLKKKMKKARKLFKRALRKANRVPTSVMKRLPSKHRALVRKLAYKCRILARSKLV